MHAACDGLFNWEEQDTKEEYRDWGLLYRVSLSPTILEMEAEPRSPWSSEMYLAKKDPVPLGEEFFPHHRTSICNITKASGMSCSKALRPPLAASWVGSRKSSCFLLKTAPFQASSLFLVSVSLSLPNLYSSLMSSVASPQGFDSPSKSHIE